MHQQPHDVPHKTQSPSPDVPKQPPDSNKGNGTGEEAAACVCVFVCVAGETGGLEGGRG